MTEPATRGTTNRNVRGNVTDRLRRREYLVETYRADADGIYLGGTLVIPALPGKAEPACRCYRCGVLLTVNTVTADRIIPGCRGGTYRRNNIRPACGQCNSIHGGGIRRE